MFDEPNTRRSREGQGGPSESPWRQGPVETRRLATPRTSGIGTEDTHVVCADPEKSPWIERRVELVVKKSLKVPVVSRHRGLYKIPTYPHP